MEHSSTADFNNSTVQWHTEQHSESQCNAVHSTRFSVCYFKLFTHIYSRLQSSLSLPFLLYIVQYYIIISYHSIDQHSNRSIINSYHWLHIHRFVNTQREQKWVKTENIISIIHLLILYHLSYNIDLIILIVLQLIIDLQDYYYHHSILII